MDIQIVLSDCTLSTEDQAVVDAVNQFLAWLPDDAEPKPALRLAMAFLEAADVAPQDDLAQVAGYAQSRSLREYIRRLREEGLAGLWDHPIPGRPAITTRTPVERALFQVVLSAVIEEQALPDDDTLAHLLPMAAGYAVSATQWLLTAIFSVIYGIRRAFHLDDVRDVGFALLTGRPRPLTHGTFQHLLWSIPGAAAHAFYRASARLEVQALGDGERRISLDGHNLPRWTQVVELVKGKIGNTGRILKAEELVLAYDLDDLRWLGLRVYQGTKKLGQGLVELVRELLELRGDLKGKLRLFFDKGGYSGRNFQDLSEEPRVHFYTPAVRYSSNVEQWERLEGADFDPEPFVFDKHADLPEEERPVYRLADTEMSINVWENHEVVDAVTLRALVTHDPEGEKPAERWPLVLFTDDRQCDARAVLNEFGDHWRQEFGHRVGKHDLCLDILPPGYILKTHRDDQGALHREVEYDQTAFFLSAWLRCLVANLMSRFAQMMGGEYAKMWAGTLLRKFIRRPATLYLIGKELHVVFDPFPGQEELQPLLDELNAKRTALPWLNDLVVQFSIAQDEPIHPLTEPEKRNRLFGNGGHQ